MKIDWKKVHDVLPCARFVAWDSDGEAFAYAIEIEHGSSNWFGVGGRTPRTTYKCIPFLDNQCPGQWDKVLLEFPGHYGETEADIGTLEAKLQALTKKVEEGKAASKDLRALSRAMGHIDAFLADTAAMKALDAAGIEVVFKERQQ